MLGAQKIVDFVVALAAPSVRGDSLLLMQNREALIRAGLSTTQCETYLSVLRTFFGQVARGDDWSEQELAQTMTQKMGRRVPTDFAKAFRLPWMKSFIAYDPASDISRTACPVMAINGTLDTQVPSVTNLETLRRLLPQRSETVIKAYDRLNHMFQHAQTGLPTEYAEIEETISEEVLSDIASWISTTLAK